MSIGDFLGQRTERRFQSRSRRKRVGLIYVLFHPDRARIRSVTVAVMGREIFHYPRTSRRANRYGFPLDTFMTDETNRLDSVGNPVLHLTLCIMWVAWT